MLTLAYEPVWAIGSGATRSVTTEELFSTILLIKKILSSHISESRVKKIPILYGGSVSENNAGELSQVRGVDGFLIGRASLDDTRLEAIAQSVNTD